MKIIYTILALVMMGAPLQSQQHYNPLSVDVTRALTQDIFESNDIPYIQPMVASINATSNSRFYDQAYVPKEVDKPYFRLSINGMVGNITDEMRVYQPSLSFGPPLNIVETLGAYGKAVIGPDGITYVINDNYQDTLGLTTALIRELFRSGLDSGFVTVPDQAATLFGNMPGVAVGLPNEEQMRILLVNHPLYMALDSAAQAGLDSLLTGLPLPTSLTLPPGVDMRTLIAAVPQLEIGSLWGTEMLIRFVPPIEFDKNIGKFAFWGFGLKHSISQYFPERWFDMAVQGVYQGTSLSNTVGFTEAKLEADAEIWSGNVHISKEWWETLTVYTGFNYEYIDVTTNYTYVLPQEVQIALGLLPEPPLGEPAVPTEDQPGDNRPQTSVVKVSDDNMKWTIGASAYWEGFRIAVDYSVSQFNIFSAGISYTF